MKKRRQNRFCGFCLSALLFCSGFSPFSSAVPRTAEAAAELPAAEEAPELQHQNIELYPDGNEAEPSVTLQGLMPENASAAAVDVTADYECCGDLLPEADADEMQTASLLAAYDITITDADNTAYQPDEDCPILVEIALPELTEADRLTLWHIHDDGTQEQVPEFTVTDGKISFYASGFSVYAIVGTGFRYAGKVSELTANPDGFLLSYGSPEYYFTASVNSSGALAEVTERSAAAVWFFEEDEGSIYLYTLIGGEKYYLNSASGSNNVSLSRTNRIALDISKECGETAAENAFYIRKESENRWLQHSNSGGGVRFYESGSNAANAQIKALYSTGEFHEDDPLGLDGKTYGLMSFNNTAYGSAMQAEMKGSDALALLETRTKVNPLTHDQPNFQTDDQEVTMWTFEWISGDQYRLSAETADGTRWLCINENGSLTLTDSAGSASAVQVTAEADNRIRLTANGRTVEYQSSNKRFRTAAANKAGQNSRLYLVERSPLTEEDFVPYSASKVDIGDPQNSDPVIIYIRVWDEESTSYKFYVVDSDGSLIPCMERGDSISWIGSQVNTLTWQLTVHPSGGYYDLQNISTGQYLAPQMKIGQLVQDRPIGLNLPGREKGAYYSKFLAWEDYYYAFIGMKPDEEAKKLVPCAKNDCATFYFAILRENDPAQQDELHELETLDNNDFGITMKMYDFPNNSVQNRVLADNADNHDQNTMPGLTATSLESDGYPIAKSGESLGELYRNASDVNHLFLKSTYHESGYFEFDSCQTFATLVPTGDGNFTVYQELGTSDNLDRPTLKHGQFFPYNTIQPGVFSKKNPYNLYSVGATLKNPDVGALSFDDPRKYEKMYTVGSSPNYCNVFEMSADFVQTPDGTDAWGHDIIFEFTGDDDFWFYVDGELVIDLGGVHSALGASVNFATGEVTVNGTHTTLRDLFYENCISRGASEAEAEAYVSSIFKQVTRRGKTCWVFSDYSPHTMRIFYMERGGGASNLHLRFNLSQIKQGQLTLKKVLGGVTEGDFDFSLKEYPFQIYYWYEGETIADKRRLNDSAILADEDAFVRDADTEEDIECRTYTSPDPERYFFDDVYFLAPNQSISIQFPAQFADEQHTALKKVYYYIRECGINTHVYDSVSFSGTEAEGTPCASGSAYCNYSTEPALTEERSNVICENHVNAEFLRTLKCRKILLNADGTEVQDDPTEFTFRLYLGSETGSSDLELAYMCEYHILNPAGEYCIWDYDLQEFRSTGKTDFSELTEAEQAAAAFDTSGSGTVSRVLAGYTVEVRNLPVGTHFRIEEWDSSIPLGYARVGYQRMDGTFLADKDNEGFIRETEDPSMAVINQRGIGLEVNKVWSDADYVSWHDDIYVALYAGEPLTLLADTVRKIESPQTAVRYYFDSLHEGVSDIRDYTVREVKLTDPGTDAEGNVTYSAIEPVDEGGSIQVDAVRKNPSEQIHPVYTAAYGPVEVSGAADHTRTDTVTNTPADRIKIMKYHWNDKNRPLSGAVFTLNCGGEPVGSEALISDADGCVTVLQHPAEGAVYELTETGAPDGYLGMEFPVTFRTDGITENPNGEGWAEFEADPTGEYLAILCIYDRLTEFRAVKIDGGTLESETKTTLADAHFTLYPGVINNSGNLMRGYFPVDGFEDLVTGADGLLAGIDGTLSPGTYYLSETEAPEGYKGLTEDLVFRISARGKVTVLTEAYQSCLKETDSGDTVIFTLYISNACLIIAPTGLRTPKGMLILTLLSGSAGLLFLCRRKRRRE